MRTPTRRKRALVAFGAAILALTTAASGADPRVGFREPAPASDGLSVSARLDAGNQSYDIAPLPRAPSVVFQVRLAPPISGEPVADGAGGLLVVHAHDRVTALDAVGRSVWSVRVGVELASGAIPFGAGKYLLVARSGRLFELSATGSITERPALPWNDIDGAVLYTPTSDGGTILAAGVRLARLAPAGARGFQTRLKNPILAVFDWRGATLAVGRDGSLWLRGNAGDARKLGSLDAPLVQALLVEDRVLGLIQHELVSFDLASGRESVVWADPALELHDVASARGQKTRLVAGRSLVVELDAAGHELGRFPLPTAETTAEITSLAIDRTGASLVVASGLPLWFVTPEGDPTSVAGTGCPDPLRLTPVAPNRIVAACRSGLLRGLSDKAR
jgi:hypothetical protein